MCSRTVSVSGTRATCSITPRRRRAAERLRVAAEEAAPAPGGPRQAGEQAHRRGLAGAVGAQQRRHLAGLEVEA